jgi:hypothetical protein
MFLNRKHHQHLLVEIEGRNMAALQPYKGSNCWLTLVFSVATLNFLVNSALHFTL